MNVLNGKKTWIGAGGLIIIAALKIINGVAPLPEFIMSLAMQAETFFQGLAAWGIGHKVMKK